MDIAKEIRELFDVIKLIDENSKSKYNSIYDVLNDKFGIPKSTLEGWKRTYDKNGDLSKKKGFSNEQVTFVSVMDFLKLKYSSSLFSPTFPIDKDYYIYYYEDRSQEIKMAVFSFDKSDSEWEKGSISYFSGSIESKFHLERVLGGEKHSTESPEFLYFKAFRENPGQDKVDQINFFTLHINKKSIKSRYLFFVTVSAINDKASKNIPSVNFGIFQRIEHSAVNVKLRKPVENWIKASLYGKNLNFDENEFAVYKNHQDFIEEIEKLEINEFAKNIKEFQGIYFGFYPRKSQEQRNLGISLLEIKPDGKVTMYVEGKEKNGYASFGSKDNLIINLDRNQNMQYSNQVVYVNLDEDCGLVGIFSGINRYGPFSRVIILIKANGDKNIKVLINDFPIGKFTDSDFKSTISSKIEKLQELKDKNIPSLISKKQEELIAIVPKVKNL